MSQRSCPFCGLTVSFKRGESTDGELCLRCFARSGGTRSVLLRPGARPKPLGAEARVREILHKIVGHLELDKNNLPALIYRENVEPILILLELSKLPAEYEQRLPN